MCLQYFGDTFCQSLFNCTQIERKTHFSSFIHAWNGRQILSYKSCNWQLEIRAAITGRMPQDQDMLIGGVEDLKTVTFLMIIL